MDSFHTKISHIELCFGVIIDLRRKPFSSFLCPLGSPRCLRSLAWKDNRLLNTQHALSCYFYHQASVNHPAKMEARVSTLNASAVKACMKEPIAKHVSSLT
mgnify:FL=1